MVTTSTAAESTRSSPENDSGGPALEELDALVEITSPRAWASLAMLAFVCVGAVVFAVVYEVPKKVHGEGILLVERDALAQVRSPGEGRLASLDVKFGDQVTAKQTIGLLSQEDLKDEIQETEARLADLKNEHDRLSAFEEEEHRTQKLAVDRLRQALQTTIDNNRAGLKVAERIKDGARRLLSRNLLNNLDLLESMEKLYEIRTNVDSSDSKLAELDLTWLSAENARNKASLQRRLELTRLETKLSVERAKFDRRSQIVSPVDGKVTQILSAANELVHEGSPVVLLSTHWSAAADESRGPSECVVFVPAGEGKKINAGDDVEVVPATVKREEHGFILGRVSAVSEMPATRLALETALPHPDLVDSFLKRYAPGVLLRVHVDLKEPPPGGAVRTNRFLWSSRSGPDQPLKTATMCQAAVVVERQRMIELIVPWTKRMLSLD